MPRRLISSRSSFEERIGYSRAVVDGEWVFVSGTTGYDYATMTLSGDVVEQCERAFLNIDAALREAGTRMDDVARVTYIVPDRADWEPCWPVTRKWLGQARPAATLLHAGLQDEAMKIEIQVTARLRRRQGDAV
ncbi:MAG: RidA family protein [Roseomonas sp.]|jgi:enamine deaminase RidA (YjgF/YER057c/UK114 family)|nr:RidA family protein [Roseomonas sp.]